MNAALKLAQFEYDNRLPVERDDAAEREWIESGIEQLVLGADVRFKRRLCGPQGVTFERFAVAVDEFAMEKLSASGASSSALGRMVIGGLLGQRSTTRQGVIDALDVADPLGELRRIAEGLLRPLAADGLIAQAEDDEL